MDVRLQRGGVVETEDISGGHIHEQPATVKSEASLVREASQADDARHRDFRKHVSQSPARWLVSRKCLRASRGNLFARGDVVSGVNTQDEAQCQYWWFLG